MSARKTYKIPFPTMYAVPGTPKEYCPGGGPREMISEEEAYAFNCIQRGHQNTVENMPSFVALLLLNWFTFPLVSGICGFVWIIGKMLYMAGYATNHEKRVWGAVSYLGLLTLFVTTLISAAYMLSKKEAF